MALRGDSDSVVMTDSSNQDFRKEMSTGHQNQEGQLEKFEDDSSVEDECSELGEENHCSEREDEMENSEETDDDAEEEEEEDYSDRDVSDQLEAGSIHGEGDDERGAVHDRLDVAEELDMSSMEDTGRVSQEMGAGVSQPLQLDHVDFILDSIDAELSEIINRADVTGQTSHNKRNTNHITKNLPQEHTQPLNNGNQLMTEEKALDTGLGTGSPGDSREASPKPFHQPRKTNSKRKGKRLKKPPNDWSDAESIASVDVRARVQEVLTKHEPSQHESLLALTPRSMDSSALPASPLYDSNRGDDFNENHVKYPKIPNSALRQSSDSSSKMPRSSKNGKHKKPNSKRSKRSPDFDVHAHDDSLRVIEQWKSDDNVSDLESIATEDFETKYQQFALRTPSPNIPSVSTLPADGSSQNVHGSAEDLRKLVLAQSIRPRTSFVKEEKSVLPAPPRESGLPEYMYLKKEITESDVGSDSVWTEDYEAQYWKAGLNKQKGFPFGRGVIPKMAAGLDSDRDSVQTEDYESHFNHLMVKQLAGVPLQYYDGVSVASDLDSFQSAEVIEKVGQLKAAGVIPNRALKKRRGGKHKQRSNFLTSTPYHPKREGQTTQEQNRTIGRQIVIDDLNSVTGSCDSNESDLQPRQLQEYLSQEEELGQLPARESEFSQKIQYLISAEEDLREQVQELETSMGSIQEKKKIALDDLKSLQETVQRSRSEIQRAETIARESVGKAEDIRSELVVLEYQRDQARRELGDIEQKVLFSRSLQTGPPHHRMIRSMDNIHLVTSPNTRPQTQVVSDVREAAQFNSVPHDLVVGQQAYRDRQTYSPGERFTDQDNQTVNYREMDDKLKDERDNSSQKFKEATEEIANLRQEMEMQKDTIREAEDKLHKSLHDSSQTQNHLQNEIIALRSQLHEKVMKVTELEGTIQERERALQSARETLVDVQENVHMLQKGKEEIIRSNTEECQKLEANREVALVELRERLLNEKEGALQQLQFELEKDKEESVTKVQEELEKVRKLMKAELEERIDELTDLKEKLKQLEEAKETLGIQMRKEAEEQIQRAIITEREIWQMEAERKQEAEKRAMEESLGGEVKRMRVEMEKLKQDKEHLKESMKILKEENNKLRDENLAAGREKVEAVSEAREETRKDIQAQLDKMREDMSQEKMRETEKLREKLKNQDEELGKLRSDVRGHQQREKDSLLSVNVEKSDRSLIQELNEECKKSANILGVTPRKTPVFINVKSSAAGKSPSTVELSHEAPGSGYLPTRSQLHSALSNLKLTNDELRNMAKKLKEDGKQWQKEVMKERKVKESEIEKLQSSISHEREDKANLQEVQEEHDAEVDKLKRSLQKIKLQENSYQEQLQQKDDNMREVQRNMKAWKEETALKMARKFEEELNRELEQRMLNLSLQDDASFSHSSGSRSMDASHSGQDANTVKVLKHLQEKVKQLKLENLHLKRGRKREDVRGDDSTSNGSSNGQYSNKDHHIYKLEQKVKLLERQLSVAEERCRENAGLLSKNSLDTSKLETALTQQTKELMKMERAYERLSQSTSPYGK
ncbi:uncharacterized protein [Apostichopus japonicus]|uniref:uncharacterized protein isoform X2 n=1 Tax=Stichopus japonicus TaxID=307972 RepID=UPI003AB816D8